MAVGIGLPNMLFGLHRLQREEGVRQHIIPDCADRRSSHGLHKGGGREVCQHIIMRQRILAC
jgi:hypothetical protein